jgi:hypothetical protein
VEKRSKPVASTREELNHKETVTELIARRVHPLLLASRPVDDSNSAQQVEAVAAVPQVAAVPILPEQTPQPQPTVKENPPVIQTAAPTAAGPKRRRTSTPTDTP